MDGTQLNKIESNFLRIDEDIERMERALSIKEQVRNC